MSQKIPGYRKFSIRFFIILIIFFAILICGVFYYFSLHNHRMIDHQYLHTAQALFRDIVITRRWNAMYSGVYVEKTEGVESNPYLEDPEILGMDGTIYSLRNPAFMTREISELAKDAGFYQYKITSLNLINPINMYDDFEKEALLKFEEGMDEFYTKTETNGNRYYRYMAPLYVEESCLKCHGYQNYEIGDVRGGISVTFNIDETENTVQYGNIIFISSAILLIILAIIVIYFLIKRLDSQLYDTLGELEKANEKLEIERKQFRTIMETMPLMVYVMDPETYEIIFINNAYREKIGKDVIGEKCYQVLQGKQDVCVFCSISDIQKTDEKIKKYDRYNQYLDLDCIIIDQIIKWPDGRDVKIQFAMDISARKKAEKQLSEQKAYMDSLFESLQEGVVLAHNDGTINRINPAFEELFHYKIEEMKEKHISDILAPDRFNKKSKELWNQVANGDTIYIEAQRKTKEGYWLDISLLGAPIIANDEQIGIYAIYRDISEQIRNINEMQNLMEELKVSNDELQNTLEKLKKTQKMMITQEKLASLGMLTAGIAHEIKNPLNFINNFSELIHETLVEIEEFLKFNKSISEKDKEILNGFINDIKDNNLYIVKHGVSANGIVQNMLLHSRNVKGKHQSIYIHGLIDEYVNLTYHGIRAKNPSFNVNIITDYDPVIKEKSIIPQSFSRVLLNIFTNAFQAMFEKFQETSSDYKPELHIYTHQLEKSFEIRIRDNGPGIEKEHINYIFEPFFTTKPPGMGTGLGLSISYDIIANEHDGKLLVNSIPDDFTEFIIKLTDDPM